MPGATEHWKGQGRFPLWRPWSEHGPADTPMLDLQPPELWENQFLLLKPPSLWYLVTETLGSEQGAPARWRVAGRSTGTEEIMWRTCIHQGSPEKQDRQEVYGAFVTGAGVHGRGSQAVPRPASCRLEDQESWWCNSAASAGPRSRGHRWFKSW